MKEVYAYCVHAVININKAKATIGDRPLLFCALLVLLGFIYVHCKDYQPGKHILPASRAIIFGNERAHVYGHVKIAAMKLSSKQIAHLRGLAHSLNPVVTIGNQGLSENVLQEIERSLNAHELIKVQVAGDDRDARKAMYDAIASATGATQVHHIGKQLIFYRASETVKEKAKVVIPKF